MLNTQHKVWVIFPTPQNVAIVKRCSSSWKIFESMKATHFYFVFTVNPEDCFPVILARSIPQMSSVLTSHILPNVVVLFLSSSILISSQILSFNLKFIYVNCFPSKEKLKTVKSGERGERFILNIRWRTTIVTPLALSIFCFI